MEKEGRSIEMSFPKHQPIPSRELTYPTLGKGTSSSKVPLGGGYVIVPTRVINQQTLIFQLSEPDDCLNTIGRYHSVLHLQFYIVLP